MAESRTPTGLNRWLFNAKPLIDWLEMEGETQRDLDDFFPEAIFIAGGSSLEHVDEVACKWKSLGRPKIFFTSLGGTFGLNIVYGINEVELFRDVLINGHNIPEEYVFPPRRESEYSSNTWEEMKKGIKFMTKILNKRPGAVALAGYATHLRRLHATAAREWPGVDIRMVTGKKCPYRAGEVERAYREVSRIIEYGKKGDLIMPLIPTGIFRDFEFLSLILTPIED